MKDCEMNLRVLIDVAALVFLAIALRWIYNIWLHPLSSFKGPMWLAASDIPFAITQLRGVSHEVLKAAHDRYGSIVRIGPSTLSFIEAGAWDDIYGHKKGRAALPKDPLFYNDMLLDRKTITMATDDGAVPIRRALNQAFSYKALMQQEPLMRSHTDRLLSQLSAVGSAARNPINIRDWITFSLFDINSDFAFGEDLGCVRNGGYHEWVQFVVDYFYAATLIHQCHKFWPMQRLLAFLIPQSVREKQKKHDEASLQRVRNRLAASFDRPDFMHYFLRQARKEQLSTSVIEAQASVVILAGSETSSVAITAAIYEILAHEDVYERLRAEIGHVFPSNDMITLAEVLQKPSYLDAVVQETLRIHSPLANGFTRHVPKQSDGSFILGKRIPAGTVVTINHYAANMSERNFKDPGNFKPERWLGDSSYENDSREVVQPFSVGPRNCPGRMLALNNIKFTLVNLIHHFNMRLGEGTGTWSYNQKVFNGWVQPALPIHLEERKSCF